MRSFLARRQRGFCQNICADHRSPASPSLPPRVRKEENKIKGGGGSGRGRALKQLARAQWHTRRLLCSFADRPEERCREGCGVAVHRDAEAPRCTPRPVGSGVTTHSPPGTPPKCSLSHSCCLVPRDTFAWDCTRGLTAAQAGC